MESWMNEESGIPGTIQRMNQTVFSSGNFDGCSSFLIADIIEATASPFCCNCFLWTIWVQRCHLRWYWRFWCIQWFWCSSRITFRVPFWAVYYGYKVYKRDFIMFLHLLKVNKRNLVGCYSGFQTEHPTLLAKVYLIMWNDNN